MALRFRRDVQKASYYVWFLGAEEAKGFRGSKVITTVLPYLIDRSTFQEPLKVTLQVSHKGIKIIQGSSKHLIPHSAITSSIQLGDIVACVLLLYNPETKCPLHVHAYRCDSETTAKTLHQQLEVLINRPENQKQFEELESRIGITRMNSTYLQPEQNSFKFHNKVTVPKKAESSLESTNSTRDSECSGTLPAPLLNSPNYKQKRNLFDSLAAELRAKLNGSGPPLLLPPRDYDTVHRSKGNIFRNKFNGNEKITKNSKLLEAPENGFSEQIRSFENLRIKQSSSEEDLSLETKNPNGLIKTTNLKNRKYLPVRVVNQKPSNGSNMNEYLDFIKHKEDKIRPNIVRPINLNIKLKNNVIDNNFSQLPDATYLENIKQLNYIEQNNIPEMKLKGKNYITNSTGERCDIQKKLNLTDKQKHLQMYNKYRGHDKSEQNVYNMQQEKNGLREYYVPSSNLPKYPSRNPIQQNDYYQQDFEEIPYRQTEHEQYKYRIDNLKPVNRRNSFKNDNELNHQEPIQFHKNNSRNNNSSRNRDESFRDRFHGAKEKFRLIERSVSADTNNISNNNKYLLQSPIKLQTRNVYNEFYHGKLNENEFGRQSNIIKNSKSLSNLSKGYRHSYAENSPVIISRPNEEFKITNKKQFW